MGRRHHDEEAVRSFLHVDRRHDVGMANLRREAGFVEEHGDELRLGRDVRMHHLDGDEPLEAADAHGTREVDGGHPTRRDRAEELVAAAEKHKLQVTRD
jgi:hypothetical protein